MKIWLLHPCNQLPGDAWRESRMHSICDELVKNGHECLWWTANFSHHTKSFRSKGWKDIDIGPKYKIRLVPTPAYYQHISFARLKFHWLWSWRVYARGRKEARPDCIIVNDTPLGDSFFALLLARRFNARLILDITDVWPEHFLLAFPAQLRCLINFLFGPLYFIRKYVRRRADAISALTEDYFDIVRREAPDASPKPLLTVYNGVDLAAFRAILDKQQGSDGFNLGIEKAAGEIWAIYAGTLGRTYDIQVILEAAQLLEQRRVPIRFIVAGDGPLRLDVEQFSRRNDSRLKYIGRLKPEDLIRIYKVCDVGLCTYGPGSTVAMPDKAYDYLAAGLVIVNSLRGELADWLNARQCGVQYQADDAESLAYVLEHLSVEQGLREPMARNSFDTAMLFDRHVQYRKFVELVEALCINPTDKQAIGMADQ